MSSIKSKKRNKRRLCFVSHSSELYGAQRSLLMLLSKLDRNKFDPFIILPNTGPLVNKTRLLGIQTFVISRNPPTLKKGINNRIGRFLDAFLRYLFGWIFYFLKLTSLLSKQKPDLVYVNTIAHSSPVISAKVLRIPVLVHVRESITFLKIEDMDLTYSSEGCLTYFYLNFLNIYKKLSLFVIMNFSDKFICVSKSTKKSLQERGFSQTKIEVVYNGVNTEEFKPSKIARNQKRKDLGINQKETFIGFVGQLVPIKGIEEFMTAAMKIHNKDENCKFIVVGGWIDPLYFEKKILPLYEKYKQKNYVTFTGFKEDVKSYLSAIDIFVNSSRIEPFARVNLEAMSMEIPVIATSAGGNPEAIVDGTTGYVIPIGDMDLLVEKIFELIKNKETRKKFGLAGRDRVINNFTIAHYYIGVERVLDQLLTSHEKQA
jgi:glycosyltransferase involved in cell wall biosynthesis